MEGGREGRVLGRWMWRVLASEVGRARRRGRRVLVGRCMSWLMLEGFGNGFAAACE